MEERLVIEEAKKGNKEAFAVLYEKYKGRVYNQIFKSIKNKEDAIDLVQDVFAKVYINLKNYNMNMASFYTFVWANAKEIVIDYERKLKRRSLIFESNKTKFVDMPITDVLDISDINEYEEKLESLLENLCDSQRIAFTLACIKRRPYKQIASIMNKNEVTIRSIVFRARKKLQKEVMKLYPELCREKSKKYVAKAIFVAFLGLTTITGLAYATYRVYNDIIVEKIFTLSDLEKELPESASIISRAEALDSVNYYLNILGEESISENDIKLIRDFVLNKICWIVENEKLSIEIDSQNSNLVFYSNYNSTLTANDIMRIYNELNFPNDYNLYKDEINDNFRTVSYAKKYDNIYNTFESVNFIIKDNRISMINFMEYDYTDNEEVISKEMAIEIIKESNNAVSKIELSIEDVSNNKFDERSEVLEYLDIDEIKEKRLALPKLEIRKVWKGESIDKIIFVDSATGEIREKHLDNSESKRIN